MRRRLIARLAGALVTALVLLLTPIGVGVARADVDVEKTERAVVWVGSFWDGVVTVPFTSGARNVQATAVSFCSGWVVSDVGHIVTAGHCVLPDNETRLQMIANVITENELTGPDGETLDPTAVG